MESNKVKITMQDGTLSEEMSVRDALLTLCDMLTHRTQSQQRTYRNLIYKHTGTPDLDVNKTLTGLKRRLQEVSPGTHYPLPELIGEQMEVKRTPVCEWCCSLVVQRVRHLVWDSYLNDWATEDIASNLEVECALCGHKTHKPVFLEGTSNSERFQKAVVARVSAIILAVCPYYNHVDVAPKFDPLLRRLGMWQVTKPSKRGSFATLLSDCVQAIGSLRVPKARRRTVLKEANKRIVTL